MALCFVGFMACKNDPKAGAENGATDTSQTSPEVIEAERQHAIKIDSMAQSLEDLNTNIEKTSKELDDAINELPK